MTIEQSQATIWPTNIDMDLYGNTPHSSDHMLPSDIYCMVPSPTTFSPNSPHMYEQEKDDLSLLPQLEIQNLPTSGNQTQNSVNMEEFDLKPHFENNADSFIVKPRFEVAPNSPASQFTTDTIWNDSKDFHEFLQMEKTDSGPTLAELNFGDYNIDDFTCDEISYVTSNNEIVPSNGTANVGTANNSNATTTNTGTNITSTVHSRMKNLQSDFLATPISKNNRSELQTSTTLQQNWDENPAPPTLGGMRVQASFNASSTKSSQIFKPLKQNHMAPSCTITCDTDSNKSKAALKLFDGNGSVPNKFLKYEDFSTGDCSHKPVDSDIDVSSSNVHLQQLLCSNQPSLQPESEMSMQAHKSQPITSHFPPSVQTQPQQMAPLSCQTVPQAPLKTQQSSVTPVETVSSCDMTISRNDTTSHSETMDEKWEQIKKLLHKEDSPKSIKRERISSTSSFTASNDDHDSNDGDMSDDSSDYEIEDYISDPESAHSPSSKETLSSSVKRREKQYFWQYNVQSKGPKGQKMRLLPEEQDPHVLNTFEDPVFELGTTSKLGLRHSGKARRGDGNDISPNPRKLHLIGQQLKKLNHDINEFVPTSDLPASVRNRTRKEKNKLASRACRLKKKAQHEANKVKLFGLEQEHRQLMTVIEHIKQKMLAALLSKKTIKCEEKGQRTSDEQSKYLNELIKRHLTTVIAGQTADYVNNVLSKVKAGDISGGLPLSKIKSSSLTVTSSDDEFSND
ncbi:uncharacterized protein LOC115232556 [Octopus sinensis]|uniref:Uncharacterized protein LOC115232556 n=1 Tax=Octopus sinensis TaxID=2607531 RepID=A0A6P7U370_9MOLL|nr:uncharacterized protein LOC115232556 [Octopus sinensis]XP_036356390.1 uncharacterized protein LOC115232556 [Octopus sinensis]